MEQTVTFNSARDIYSSGVDVPRFGDILLEIWAEACQHIEIQHSASGIAVRLQADMPLESLHVMRLEPDHHWLANVAVAPLRKSTSAIHLPALSETQYKQLVAWVRKGGPVGPTTGVNPNPIALLGVDSLAGDYRLLPLAHGRDTLGALLLVASKGERFTARHDQLISAIQQPFAAALANDRRLHELATLREAAEADRRTLLRRLGRTDISDRVVGEQTGLAPVMRRVDLVSGSDAPVLLLGETGTGKEVIARSIHLRSDRRDGPFIRVNCGAIPAELVDSQLFGHEKGAFTGAGESRKGWFERADGGTLFLDEIGELPHDAQVRFLRVLQDSFIERVGGVEPLAVDVRVIAATHRDLAGMVQSGEFREDLWYRIAVFPILLPPLRERLGDLPELARHFAERAAMRFGLPPVVPTDTDLVLLANYAWPGNIRELGAVIDRAAILGEGRTLEIAAALGFGPIPQAGRSFTAAEGSNVALPASEAPFVAATLDEVARRHIEATLGRTHGQIEGPRGAAQLLGINPHTLRARMRKLGIEWGRYRE